MLVRFIKYQPLYVICHCKIRYLYCWQCLPSPVDNILNTRTGQRCKTNHAVSVLINPYVTYILCIFQRLLMQVIIYRFIPARKIP